MGCINSVVLCGAEAGRVFCMASQSVDLVVVKYLHFLRREGCNRTVIRSTYTNAIGSVFRVRIICRRPPEYGLVCTKMKE